MIEGEKPFQGTSTIATSIACSSRNGRYWRGVTRLSPEQIRFVPVADRHVEHCRTLADRTRATGLRPSVDDAKESVGKKIRAAQLMKVPYTVVVGDRDLEAGTFTIRDRNGTETPGVPFDAIVAALSDESGSRRLQPTDFSAL